MINSTAYIPLILTDNSELSDPVYSALISPWYLSWYAFLIYFAAGLGVLYLIYKLQKETLKNVEQKLMQVIRTNSNASNSKNSDLETEEVLYKSEIKELNKKLRSKTIELAAKAKETDAKNAILIEIKQKLKKLEDHPESLKSRLSEIQKILDSQINDDDQTFEIQFDEMHQRLFKKLKGDYPDLTSNDLRICAYIRMGYNSKEMAEMLSIKPSSVYISRSRLRKKLNLDGDLDLHGFLNGVV